MTPSEQAAKMRALADAVCDELLRRAAGGVPDRRFDPLLAFLEDATEEIVAWYREAAEA